MAVELNDLHRQGTHGADGQSCDRAVHYGMEQGIGRGTPEIDVVEFQPGNIGADMGVFPQGMPVGQPFLLHLYQVAPGRLPHNTTIKQFTGDKGVYGGGQG